MKRSTGLAVTCIMAFAGCSGQQAKTDEPAKERSVVANIEACEAAAEEIRAAAATLSESRVTGGYDAVVASYSTFLDEREQWTLPDSVCLIEGADVTERAHLHRTVLAEVDEAEDAFVLRAARHLETQDLEDARKFLAMHFSTHRAVSPEVRGAAQDVSRAYNEVLLRKFEASEKYAQLDESTTTCIFDRERIDPTGDIQPGFTSVFGGAGDVHALCRLPLPASKFGGDPDGSIVLLLDDDPDPKNGVVHEADLGPVEKWKETQFFRGRFHMPQGLSEDAESAAYYVTIKVQRPKLGDEYPVSNSFLWFR